MIKAVVFDLDGMVLSGTRFSDRYAAEHGITTDEMAPFFLEPFDRCIHGKADMKEELVSGGWLQKWRFKGGVDELLQYWFHCGNEINEEVLQSVAELRLKGIICVLTTNQEKYRTEYIRTELGLNRHFDRIFVSNEIGHKKPTTHFLQTVFDYFRERDNSIEKSEVLFWDDREAFVAGAKEFGFRSFFFSDFETYDKKMKKFI